MLYYNKKHPVELKHCDKPSSYRFFYLLKLKPQKEKKYLSLEYDYVILVIFVINSVWFLHSSLEATSSFSTTPSTKDPLATIIYYV